MKELSKMHEEDAHDDNRVLIAMETSNQIHTRAQIRAAKNAANSHILETKDVGNDTNSPLHVRKRATPPVPDMNEARDLTASHLCHSFCRGGRAPLLGMI